MLIKPTRRGLIAGAAALAAFSALSPGPAKALSSPYNFPLLPSTSQKLLFGGNITQVPTADGGPNDTAQWVWQYENFASVWANWVVPSIQNWIRRGGTHIRYQGGLDGVLNSNYTQTAYNNLWLNTIIPYARANGITLSTCSFGTATGSYSDIGSFTNAQIWAVVESFIVNVVNPNLDVFAYIEAGNQETANNSTDQGVSVYLAQQAATVTACPLGISSYEYPGFSWTTGAPLTLLLVHMYPQLNGFPATLQGALTQLEALLQGNGPTPTPWFLIEENGYNGTNVYSAKQNWLNALFTVAVGHPCCVGYLSWGGQGPSPDGDWSLWTIPSNTYSPTADWTDNAASIYYAGCGPANRDQKLNFTATGTPSITSTQTAISLTCVTGGLTVPTEANFTNSQLFNVVCPISLTGTVSISGDSSTTYKIWFQVEDHYSSIVTIIGTPLSITGSATNAVINMSGNIPTAGMRADITMQSQITAGSVSGTITALSVTQTLGVAPALLPPASTPVFGVL